MKNKVKAFLVLVSIFAITCVTAQNKVANIRFDTKKHDFGTIDVRKDSVVSVTFLFTNTGNSPLVIQKVSTSCGCTISNWTKSPIAPGQRGFVKVVFNSKGITGKFSKSIYVKSNAKEDVIILKIEGVVSERKSKSIFNRF
jgi:hypothetical protein